MPTHSSTWSNVAPHINKYTPKPPPMRFMPATPNITDWWHYFWSKIIGNDIKMKVIHTMVQMIWKPLQDVVWSLLISCTYFGKPLTMLHLSVYYFDLMNNFTSPWCSLIIKITYCILNEIRWNTLWQVMIMFKSNLDFISSKWSKSSSDIKKIKTTKWRIMSHVSHGFEIECT